MPTALSWLGIDLVNTTTWANFDTIKDCWLDFIYVNDKKRKSFTSLLMLTSLGNLEIAQRYGFWKCLFYVVYCCNQN
jgi:hypothetical protein